MNKKKLLYVVPVWIVLSLLFSGCQSDKNTIEPPSIPMKTVTQNDKEDLVTYEFQLPENWVYGAKSQLSVAGLSEEAKEILDKNLKTTEESFPLYIGIGNYYYSGLKPSEEKIQMYKDLFAGKPDAYEKNMDESFDRAIDMINSGTSSNASKPEVSFQYKHYDGTSGKITEVQYSYTFNGKKTHMIQCYLEDIPYSIVGAFDDSLELSSGEIAPWVASSLKVTEHFTIDDGVIRKKN